MFILALDCWKEVICFALSVCISILAI